MKNLKKYSLLLLLLLLIISINFSFIYTYSIHSLSTSLISHPLMKKAISALFFLSEIMMIFAYFVSMMTSNQVSGAIQSSSQSTSICKRCQKPKPLRAHHCKKCDTCIRKMDHHCYLIANCVGESNQKSFFLLLFYALIASFNSSNSLFQELLFLVHRKEPFIFDFRNCVLIIGYLMSIVSFIFIGLWFIGQLNWLVYGMTAVEWKMYPKKYECPFFERKFRKHFIEVFGKVWYLWFWPSVNKISGDTHRDEEYVMMLNKKKSNPKQNKKNISSP